MPVLVTSLRVIQTDWQLVLPIDQHRLYFGPIRRAWEKSLQAEPQINGHIALNY